MHSTVVPQTNSLGRRARLSAAFLVLFGASLTAACGGDAEDSDDPKAPVLNIAGQYSIATTNGPSSCEFEWDEGATSSNTPLTVTQSGTKLTADVGGPAAVVFLLFLGTTRFEGEIDGDELHLVAYGTRPQTQGNCTSTLNATIQGKVNGDVISGTITYAPATNDNPDCTALKSCSASQAFNGTRPPT